MNINFISLLLGMAVVDLQVASQVGQSVYVSVSPSGQSVYLGESVLLRCVVEAESSFVWSYEWTRHQPTPTPRHRVLGDSYSITAVTREDADSYLCRAERQNSSNTWIALVSQPATLRVSETSPPALILTPDTRQLFSGDNFTVQCPSSHRNSSDWMLRQFSPGRRVRKRVLLHDQCSSLGGAVNADKPDTCMLTAVNGSTGLYWCEDTEGRSNAVSITVSHRTDDAVILRSPASPVLEGARVDLYCHYHTGKKRKTTFFKDELEIATRTSAERVITMTIANVTLADEGLYKCASKDEKAESPGSWLSVTPDRGNRTATDSGATTTGSWKWLIVAFIIILLVFIPLTVWLVRRSSYQVFSTKSCWPVSKQDLSAVELPATKQDVTEVQWDLSWMEMSNLLDKQLYPGT